MLLAATVLLQACADGRAELAGVVPLASAGPRGDYPIVLGAPFIIDGVTHTPIDRLNYDAVGYASAGADGGEGITAAHRTLPLPSYVEITSLASGKTVLVRAERRGPMRNDRLVELSPGAAAQLGIVGDGEAPVRVRRVNPTEPERARLRGGGRAPERMATPKPLLTVLMRKLETEEGRVATSSPAAAPSAPSARPDSPPVQPSVNQGGKVVQVASFSTRERADGVAAKLGARIEQAGRYSRVLMGPFAAHAEAEAALAKARAAGYSDARIQRAN